MPFSSTSSVRAAKARTRAAASGAFAMGSAAKSNARAAASSVAATASTAAATASAAGAKAITSFPERSAAFKRGALSGARHAARGLEGAGRSVVLGGAPQDIRNALFEASDFVVDAARAKVVDELARRYDSAVAAQRRFYLGDPSLPCCFRRPLERLWDAAAPNVREEVLTALETGAGVRLSRRLLPGGGGGGGGGSWQRCR